ncbi:farnesyl cysteine-carboxyl methyltransferase [Xanthoria calcicola]
MGSSLSYNINASPPQHSRIQHGNGHVPEATDTSITPIADSKKSPSAISLRAFLLGTAFGVSLALTVVQLQPPLNPLWRAPCFLVILSTFHFLEFYITARYNPSAATLSAFLLAGNGYAYNVAHTLAFLECILRNYVAPRYYAEWLLLQPFNGFLPVEGGARVAWLTLGLTMLLGGQGIRTLAMAQAGTNFNHLVQSRKKEGHVLVTNGIYGWLRHPSYFGFFWWGLGTQLIMGNLVCLVGYAVVLWRFFSLRIQREEKFLVAFFGADYIRYRDETAVGIPMIP